MTLLLDVIGSIGGGVVANALGTGDHLRARHPFGSAVAVTVAVVLVVIGERAGAPRRRTSR